MKPKPAIQPRTSALGFSRTFAPAGRIKRTEAHIAASRLPSFHFQTRTRTVIGRPQIRSQFRFASSGSHSPPRWRNARAPMRSFAFPVFPSPGSAKCPYPSQEKSFKGLRPPQFPRPSGTRITLLSGLPVTRPSLTHTNRRVLAEPSKDNKKKGHGQFTSVKIAF